jgi:hypothetical protein
MIKSTNRRYIVLGSAVIIILLMAAFQFILSRGKTVTTTTTTEQIIAQNDCARQQYANYTKDKLAISQSQGGSAMSSVERIVALRRLEEQFCSEFARCIRSASATDARLSETDAASFVSCLRDEMFKRYYGTLPLN